MTLVVLGDLDQQSLLFQHIDLVLCWQLPLSAGLMSLDILPYMTPELGDPRPEPGSSWRARSLPAPGHQRGL